MPSPPPDSTIWTILAGYASGIATIVTGWFAYRNVKRGEIVTKAKDAATAQNLLAQQTAANVPLHEQFLNEQTRALIAGLNQRVEGLVKDLERANQRIDSLEARATSAELRAEYAIAEADAHKRRADDMEKQRDEWMRKASDVALRQETTVAGLEKMAKVVSETVATDNALVNALDLLQRPASHAGPEKQP